ncbi:MAG: glycoside hydrolase [Hungatella sp.]|jgi:glucan-binding YG repeat protein/GH25 family lysozyme M1 (1,4-beta-N-acetylmuramidase)|nr:glycoside hydrolase [Hungatella sp.]
MKNKKYLVRRCQCMAMAGMIAVMTGAAAKPVWADGPGGNTSSQSANEPGPGNPGSGNASSGSSSQSNPNAWKRSGNVYLMPDGSPINNVLRRGIDVSRWQGEVNWSQVAADDVSFVMLGTRSKGEIDPYFHKNIQGAANAGVQVGAYIYSLATTPQMAVEEANFVLNLIKDYPVSYPVAFDMEDDVQKVLSKEQLAEIANAFCSTISAAGYYPIIYANEYWLNNHLDMSLMNYPVWVARYSVKPTYGSPVMWQATSTGSVKGISGNVDIDFQFRDFSDVIPANTWRTIAGKTHYYSNYVLQKDSWIHDGDGWYYMDSDGLALKNWQILGDERYYLDETSGKMQYGWQADGGTWYYLGSSGAAAKGWISDSGAMFFADRTNGAMRTGWLEDEGKTYFLKPSGKMATGWVRTDDKWYYMDGSGVLSKGWVNDNDKWFFFDQSGVMQTGWVSDGGQRYYLGTEGARATGWNDVDGVRYYFDGEGRMTTGWQSLDNSWYYLNSDGSMATGLTDVNGVKYYLNPEDGRMAADTEVTVGDTTYRADGSGALSVVMPEEASAEGTADNGDNASAPAAPVAPGESGN